MITVEKYGIIISPTDLEFENNATFNPGVIQDGNTVHILYRATQHGNFSTIGYAKTDGPLKVIERKTEPLVSREFEYETNGLEDPRIVKIDDLYYITFTAYDGNNALGALATSKDLVHFEKHGIITPKINYRDFEALLNQSNQTKLNPKYHHYYHLFVNLGISDDSERLLNDKDVVLFTTVGAVTNTRTTQLTGNVGSNVGSSTGFGNVDGVMHDQDGASAAAGTDLATAYGQLNAAIPTLFPGTLLGNGVTLNAGVYSIPAPTVLNLTLNLDVQNNPNAVFIFQIDGAFSTNAQAKVKLLNGALACNVYWKIEGAVSMATGTTMRGTVIANNAAITMSAGDTLEGRALSINGAVSVTNLFAYTPTGCGSPTLTGPANPVLGTTECFSLFSGIGPVTNSGITNATGDIGTNSGLTTVFNPLLVTGMIHPIPDGVTSQCGTDFTNVYNNINLIPHDIQLLYPAQFGNNLVLTPHTYWMNGAVSVTDTLYLNAAGNPNGVFVIKVNGAFSTNTYSKVILINGAQAKNVYWKIDGAVDINDYSVFRGTIIAQGAINLFTGVTLYGRALTGVRALTTTAVNVIMPTSCAPYTTTEPTNQIVCLGGSATFSVNTTGLGLTYQWRKGNVNLTNGGSIYGANTTTLIINLVTALDVASNYNVIISGSFLPNDTSNLVSLTLTTAPTITTQPTNQTVCAGDNATFSVIASGSNLTYQWRKGTVNIAGETNATLTLNAVTVLDVATNYNVVVTGACAPNETSDFVTFTMNVCSIDLSVVKTCSDSTPSIGTTILFTIVARNNSVVDATGVSVIELLQSGYVYVSSSMTAGTYNHTTGTWNIGTLNAESSATLTIAVAVASNGIYSNSVSISGNEPDLTPANDTTTIILHPIDFFIPQGFSPNDDGINDLFVIRGIFNNPNNSITIYNRWGGKVFEASPYTNTWNGTSQSDFNIGGNVLPVGTYFYVLDLGNDSDALKGTIYLNK